MEINPFEEKKWLHEFHQKTDHRQWQDFIFTGHSLIEDQLSGKELSGEYRELNRKTRWLEVVRDLNLYHPETVVWPLEEVPTFIKVHPEKLPVLVKYQYASGGGGTFHISESDDQQLDFALSRLNEIEKQSLWLVQKRLDPIREWSFCYLPDAPPQTFEVSYDNNNFSWRHRKLPTHPHWKELAKYLKNELKYEREFGFDGFEDRAKRGVPLIDLNVRLTKGHFILQAADLFGIAANEIDSQRYRFRSQVNSFENIWQPLKEELNLNELGEAEDGHYVYPYLLSMEPHPKSVQPIEITVFTGKKGTPAGPNLSTWQQSVYNTLKEILES